MILPLATFLIGGSAILENILSMIFLLLPLIQVSKTVWGCKKFEDESFIDLFICSDESNLSKSILKSPIRKSYHLSNKKNLLKKSNKKED